MMQPTLDGPAELFLTRYMAALRAADEDTVLTVAEDTFAIDIAGPMTQTDEDGTEREVPFAKDDAETMIEGRLLDAMSAVGMARFEYVDHETYEPDPKPGPALEQGIRRLAASLHTHVYGNAGYVDEDTEQNYLADARELAQAYPHLLSGWERGIVPNGGEGQ